MKLYGRIFREKIYYTNISEEVISAVKKNRIMKVFHLLPSLVSSVYFTVKILPISSQLVKEDLDSNSPMMWVYCILSLFLVSILNGWVIEFVLVNSNKEYRLYKEFSG